VVWEKAQSAGLRAQSRKVCVMGSEVWVKSSGLRAQSAEQCRMAIGKRLRAFNFGLLTSDFGLRTSDFGLPVYRPVCEWNEVKADEGT